MGRKVFILILGIFLYGCTTPLTPQQREEIQVRELQGNFENAFRSTIAVLQNKGYIIEHTDYNGGLIRGETPIEKNMFQDDSKFGATVTIEQFGKNRVRERITFVRIKIDDMAIFTQREEKKVIDDRSLYQEVFYQIQQEILIRQTQNP